MQKCELPSREPEGAAIPRARERGAVTVPREGERGPPSGRAGAPASPKNLYICCLGEYNKGQDQCCHARVPCSKTGDTGYNGGFCIVVLERVDRA
ncbi:UNVERIFIED_CONTAM: hypothetical protein FKN15_034884 [Acipenser sinensis]